MANLEVFKIISELLFATGIVVLAVAIVRGREARRHIAASPQRAVLDRMLLLATSFLVAYSIALCIVLLGRFEILSVFTGLVFAAGAVYVWTSVKASAEVTVALQDKQ